MKKNLFVQKQPICSTLYFFHHNFFLDEYLSYFFLHPSNVIYTQTHFFKEYVPKNRMYNINLLPFPNLYALPCCTHLSLYTLLRYLHSFLYISLSISPISSILFLSLSPTTFLPLFPFPPPPLLPFLEVEDFVCHGESEPKQEHKPDQHRRTQPQQIIVISKVSGDELLDRHRRTPPRSVKAVLNISQLGGDESVESPRHRAEVIVPDPPTWNLLQK